MNEHKAKNCPCCGGAAVVAPVAGSDECYVVCPDCLLSSDYYPSYEEAVKAWNNRPLEDEKDKEIEKLKEALKQIDDIAIGENILGLYEDDFRQIKNIIKSLGKDNDVPANDTDNY